MISLSALALISTLAYTSNPVQVTTCSLDELFIPVTTGDFPTQQAAGSQLHIRFTNVSTAPLSSVTFDVAVNGTERTIVDTGTFSQGASISHYFPQTDIEGGDATCKVRDYSFSPSVIVK